MWFVGLLMGVSMMCVAQISEGSGSGLNQSARTDEGSDLPAIWSVRYGPKLGLDLFTPEKPTSHGKEESGKFGTGCSIGFMFRFQKIDGLFLETGLQFSYDYSPVPISDFSASEGKEFKDDYTLDRGSFLLPLKIGYNFRLVEDMAIGIFAGPQVSCGLWGSLAGPDSLNKYKFYGKDGVWKRVCASLTFGVSFDVGRNLGVIVDADMGLTNMAKRDIFPTRTMSESVVRISIMYWLGTGFH